MHFSFASTPSIHFGPGQFATLPDRIAQFGKNVLIVTGKASFLQTVHAKRLLEELTVRNLHFELEKISGEPSPAQIDEIAIQYRDEQIAVVLAIGGGSVLDAGKAISAMLCETESIITFLEGVGTRQPSGRKVPLIAVPTTSGTGSEATKNAVITQAGKNGFKKSLRHDQYIPNIALVDPLLTLDCPADTTAASGMDAFTQLLESYLSTKANPFTDALAFEGLRHITSSITEAVNNGQNIVARTSMSYAALISGMTIANAGLGIVHGFAQPLGSFYEVPHGKVCGTLMGAANRITVERLREEANLDVLEKYFNVARLITPNENRDEAIDTLLDYLDQLTANFNLPVLSDYGITPADFPLIIANTGQKEHPVRLTDDDLKSILMQRL
jgi:alcohol dehydrogenase class IV